MPLQMHGSAQETHSRHQQIKSAPPLLFMLHTVYQLSDTDKPVIHGHHDMFAALAAASTTCG